MSHPTQRTWWQRIGAVVGAGALLVTSALVTPAVAEPAVAAAPPSVIADGSPHRVTHDRYSFMVDGERINVYAGEFHYWRLPSPDAWRDVLQKIKASGFNAVSLYFFWGLHQSEEGGEFDFTGIKDIDRLLTMCEEEGLYVIARPGPYINAEISMGGLPAYMTNKGMDSLRSMDNIQPSKEWLHAFNAIAARHQVTDGKGSIIMYQVENELYTEAPRYRDFLTELVKAVKADGITVPLFHNDWGYGGRYANTERYGTDFYASDIYPLGFNCSAERRQLPDQEAAFRQFAPDSPHMIAETQGGAFTPWGANFNPDQCARFADESFTRQWSVMAMANGVTALGYYMTHGGTNWGWTGAPASGFTSYDYGAALTEDRTITPKLAAQKEAGYFHRAFPALTRMDPVTAPTVADVEGAPVKAYQRVEPTGGIDAARLLAFRLQDTNRTTETAFTTSLWLEDQGADEGATTVDDRDPAIRWAGQWRDVEDRTASGRTLRTATEAGARATFTFEGTGIRYLSASGTDHGRVRVQIDDRAPQDVTGWVSTDQNKPVQVPLVDVQDLAPGQHTITVTALGQPADGGQGTTVSVDAFEVTGTPDPDAATVHNDSSGFLTFEGDWEHASGKPWTAGDVGGDESFSATKGDAYTFTFDGVGFDLIAPHSGNHGAADVHVDGQLAGRTEEQTVGSATPQQVVFAKHDLEQGRHTVRVVVRGEPFPGSSGTFVSVDAVRVHPTEASVQPTPTGDGWARIPQTPGAKLHLHGRDAIALAANFDLAGRRIGYTTAQLFGAPQPVEGGVVQYLMGVEGDPAEIVVRAVEEPQVTLPQGVTKRWDVERGELLLSWTTTARPQDIVVRGGERALTLRAVSRDFAADVWQLEAGTELVTVEGATLARTARRDGRTLHLTGSMASAGTLRVLADGVDAWTWNGTPTTGAVPGPAAVATPELSWRMAPGAPEADPSFDVSGWTRITSTRAENRRQGPGPSSGLVLDSNHHGFLEGDVWYRATYTADERTSITLQANGGSGVPGHGKDPAFGQVWVNGTYVGAFAAAGEPQTLQLPTKPGEQVELAVLVHNLGQNLDWDDTGLSRQSRGLHDAALNTAGDVEWRIQGAQSPAGTVDTERTMYNNGGLYGERAGWHLPGHPISDWTPADSFEAQTGGVWWYATDVTLDVPTGQDQAYQVRITPRGGIGKDRSQVTLFVNGWNTGVYIGDIGPQTTFTIPAQFLNLRGTNRLALAVAAKDAGAGPAAVEVVPVAATTGSVIGDPLDAAGYPARTVTGSVSAAGPRAAIRAVRAEAATPSELAVETGETVRASAAINDEPLAGGEVTRIEYAWGDGQVTSEPTHAYRAAGRYEVEAVVRDAVSGQQLARDVIATVVVAGADGPTPGTPGPSDEPSSGPSDAPPPAPSAAPSTGSTSSPAPAPTGAPSVGPTGQPTEAPATSPTGPPSRVPRPGLPATGA